MVTSHLRLHNLKSHNLQKCRISHRNLCTINRIYVFTFQASLICERDMSNLTLSDREQRELYEAAQIIQKAYRSYKGRKGGPGPHGHLRAKASTGSGSAGPSGGPQGTCSQDKEAKAAVVIQNYYRR